MSEPTKMEVAMARAAMERELREWFRPGGGYEQQMQRLEEARRLEEAARARASNKRNLPVWREG